MEYFRVYIRFKGYSCNMFLIFVIWLSSFENVTALQTSLKATLEISSANSIPDPPSSGVFEPIEISPAVIPRYPFPGESLPPMYPSFPTTYEPVLTGKCPVKFSAISDVMDKTASDCSAPLASVVGNVICCPQVNSLLHIFQGHYNSDSDQLVLQKAVADECFSDIISILSSRGANKTIPALCSVKSSNLTGGSCPVKDTVTLEKMINTSKLLDACSSVDPLKECCRPVCQPAIVEAAVQISSTVSANLVNANIAGDPAGLDVLGDCKGVVSSWLSRKLSVDDANTAFRILSACKVNKACPLDFKQPSAVISACRDLAGPNPSCCSSLNTYIAGIQKQMLITNRQAIHCAASFGAMLQKGGVMTNIYELCDVDLKDFSLQAYGQEGCLLRSLPADAVFDNSSGFSFTCDLSDNIAAPWPSSSSISSLSLCAPEMSLPALPSLHKSGNAGYHIGERIRKLVPVFSVLVLFSSVV
ncbi:uncharacterized GPI-anchored protein At1g61900-like [Papaver somniferum]|uniref:uncharacterized GPI-anchored protein At1g61900-like n=1 Tax=Papaver somniferum TaxID=3469 RepID=UPI000E6FABF9|nr:uncharacterized GPI-anchored protein At1g61900-like [Papaver somniferum]XP_026448363.1 uncharacterized GPI-anchored protein At1g61900-like [Papaver somniferum]XP_026448364.1 uncharacterized GPI-anchored protein At1g61900-like [Papaver somniferum]